MHSGGCTHSKEFIRRGAPRSGKTRVRLDRKSKPCLWDGL